MNVLEVKGVSKFYGDFTALNKLDLSVPKGSIFGLLGPNGAGKTSLIRIINQITAPDEGEILLNGEMLNANHISDIGYLPEERGLYPKMKVFEQLVYLARLKGLDKKKASSEVNEWMERFEISSWKNKMLEELSKGMAQKIQFIATVIHKPHLLIFDEPFTGFDPVNTELIKSEIRRLRDRGASVIFSTHRMESVEEICDEIVLINKGEKILEGPIRDVKSSFRANEYQVRLENAKVEKLNYAEIVEMKEVGNQIDLLLRAPVSATRDLLQELMNSGDLLLFQERLPSLNEIFISKVQEP
jgi:ABC-2 type transport system ATP-binding protein